MKSRRLFLGAGLALAMAAPALADDGVFYDHARVIDSRPVYEIVRVSSPRTECRDRYVYEDARPRSYTSMIAGGVIGGIVGNQVVHGKYRDWGTVAGALLGGSLGNDYHNRHRAPATARRPVAECREIERVREERRLTGYEVTYRYQGHDHVTVMDHDPGRRVRVAVSVDVAE